MNLVKPLARRPIKSFLERSVVRLFKANPQLKVVAIGGSVGKTSTKFAVATVLSQKYRVLTNHSNYNSEFGLPLAIFELHAPAKVTDVRAWLTIMRQVRRKLRQHFSYDVLVLELGTDKPGDIAAFMRYIKPDIGLVTAITPEHMEFFGTLEAVGDEEFTLDLHAQQVVLNVGDPELKKRMHLIDMNRTLTYGAGGTITWERENAIRLHDGSTIDITPQILGQHLQLALQAAAAVGIEFALTPAEIQAGINTVQPVPGRMQRLDGMRNTTIIDDSYNSSPDAAIAALHTLETMTTSGRRIALMGQMNELGAYSRQAHQAVGQAATKVDYLLTLTGDANAVLGPAAVTAGLPQDHVIAFDSPYAVGRWLQSNVKPRDIILIKGSQNRVFAEEAIKPLLKNPEDTVRLVRQSPDWLATKREQFPDADLKL